MPHIGYFPFGGGLISLLLLGAVVFLTIWLIVSIVRHDGQRTAPPATWYGPPPGAPVGPPPPDPAVQILRERFARGELTEAQFFSAARALGVPLPQPSSSPAPGPTPPTA